MKLCGPIFIRCQTKGGIEIADPDFDSAFSPLTGHGDQEPSMNTSKSAVPDKRYGALMTIGVALCTEGGASTKNKNPAGLNACWGLEPQRAER